MVAVTEKNSICPFTATPACLPSYISSPLHFHSHFISIVIHPPREVYTHTDQVLHGQDMPHEYIAASLYQNRDAHTEKYTGYVFPVTGGYSMFPFYLCAFPLTPERKRRSVSSMEVAQRLIHLILVCKWGIQAA